MRLGIALVAIAACSGDDAVVGEREKAPFVSVVEAEDAVRALDGKPPAIIVIDDDDKTYLAAADSWERLDAGRLTNAVAMGLDSITLDLQVRTHRVAQSRVSVAYVSDDITPKRQARFGGRVVDSMAPQRALVLASPRAKAATLIEVVGVTSGAIAVAHRGHVRLLRIDFTTPTSIEPIASSWREVHVPSGTTHVIGEPWEPGPLDLIVDAEATAQELVDAIVAHHGATRVLALGHAPDPKELAKRDRRGPAIGFSPPAVRGLDTKTVVKLVEATRPRLLACYQVLLAKDPRAKTDIEVSFMVDRHGKVMNVTLTAPADIVDCVDRILGELVFPRPREETVVMYRFTMRP